MTEQSTEEDSSALSAEVGEADQVQRRHRIRWVLGVLTLFAAAIATGIVAWPVDGLAVRFYRFGIIPLEAAPVIWTAAVVLYIFFPPALPRYRKWIWGTGAAVLTLVTVPVWVLTAFAVSVGFDGSKVEAVEVSPDGRHEAVAVSYSSFDSGCRVWLRERGGLFSKQALVWEETEGYCPARVSFSGGTTIGVTESSGRKTTTTTFDPDRTHVEVVMRS